MGMSACCGGDRSDSSEPVKYQFILARFFPRAAIPRVPSIDIRKAALMNATRFHLTALTMILAAVGFAVSLTGCASTADIAPLEDSSLDDVLSRGLAANPGPAVDLASGRREVELSDRRLVVASAR